MPTSKANRVIHIFNANSYHHVIDMINNTFTFFKENTVSIEFYVHEIELYEDKFEDKISKEITINKLEKPNQLFKLIKSTKSEDRIILHSFLIPSYWFFFLFLSDKDLKKIVWICWGSGISYLNGVKGFLINMLRKRVYSKLGRIVTLMEPDKNILENNFKLQNIDLLPYYSNTWDFKNNEYLNKEIQIKQNIPLNILVGNSASATNNHKESFEDLLKYKKNRIKIICPLSYGGKEQQRIVNKNGKTLFKQKFKALLSLMPKEDYMNLLQLETDILVYHSKTQMGLFNLYFALCFGKKIFVDGYNYNWLTKNDLIVFHVSQIQELGFEEFSKPLDAKEAFHNKSMIENLVSIESIVPKWKRLFNQL